MVEQTDTSTTSTKSPRGKRGCSVNKKKYKDDSPNPEGKPLSETCFSAWYQTDSDGKIHIRYGEVDPEETPTHSVESYLLSEYVKKTIREQKKIFKAKIDEMITANNKHVRETCDVLKSKVADLLKRVRIIEEKPSYATHQRACDIERRLNGLAVQLADLCISNNLSIPSPPVFSDFVKKGGRPVKSKKSLKNEIKESLVPSEIEEKKKKCIKLEIKEIKEIKDSGTVK